MTEERWRELAGHLRVGLKLLRISKERRAARMAGAGFYPELTLEAWK